MSACLSVFLCPIPLDLLFSVCLPVCIYVSLFIFPSSYLFPSPSPPALSHSLSLLSLLSFSLFLSPLSLSLFSLSFPSYLSLFLYLSLSLNLSFSLLFMSPTYFPSPRLICDLHTSETCSIVVNQPESVFSNIFFFYSVSTFSKFWQRTFQLS